MAIADRARNHDGSGTSAPKDRGLARFPHTADLDEARLHQDADREAKDTYARLRCGGANAYYAFLGALTVFTELRPDLCEMEAGEWVMDLCAEAEPAANAP